MYHNCFYWQHKSDQQYGKISQSQQDCFWKFLQDIEVVENVLKIVKVSSSE